MLEDTGVDDVGHPTMTRPMRSAPKAVAAAGAIGMAAALVWAGLFLLFNLVGLGIVLGPGGDGYASGFIVAGVRIASFVAFCLLLCAVIGAFRRVAVVRPVIAGLCGVLLFAVVFLAWAAAETAVGLRPTGWCHHRWIELCVASFLGFGGAARLGWTPHPLIDFHVNVGTVRDPLAPCSRCGGFRSGRGWESRSHGEMRLPRFAKGGVLTMAAVRQYELSRYRGSMPAMTTRRWWSPRCIAAARG